MYSLLADINTKTCFTNDLGQNSQVISVSAKSFRRQKVFHLVWKGVFTLIFSQLMALTCRLEAGEEYK